MKNKFMPDIFVYILAPIVACNLVGNKKMDYIIIALIFTIFFYSFITRKKDSRLSVTGMIFSFGYISLYLLKQGVKTDFMRYVYDMYFFILSSISLITLKLFNNNIIKQIYTDILRSKGHTKHYIWNVLKKNTITQEFEKISSLVNIHLLSMAFIKVYSIVTYGAQKYTTTADLEILVCMLFIVAEIYMISRMKQEHKSKGKGYFKDIKKGKSMISIKTTKKADKEKIIYLNKYKRANK